MKEPRKYYQTEPLDLVPYFGLVRHAERCGLNEPLNSRIGEPTQEAQKSASLLIAYNTAIFTAVTTTVTFGGGYLLYRYFAG